MTKPIKTTTTKLRTTDRKPPLAWRDLPVNTGKPMSQWVGPPTTPEPLPEWLTDDNVSGLTDNDIDKLAEAIATEVTGRGPREPMAPYAIIHPGEVLRHLRGGKTIVEEQPGTVVLDAVSLVTNKGNPILALDVHGYLRYGDVELLANWLHDWLGHHADMHTNPKGEE